MNRKLFWVVLMVILCWNAGARAQSFAPVGTAVAQFLEIGMSARASAMGEAYTAVTNDAGSVFWNPAGLAEVGKRSLFTAYAKWPADISFIGASVAFKLGNVGTFALSSQSLMTPEMEMTTISQPEGTGQNFSMNNFCVGLSFARFLTDRFSIGVTGKLVREKYWTYGYDTWALDLGTLYRTGFHGLRIGMSILHFGPEIKFGGSYLDYSDARSRDVNKPKSFETYSLPVNFRFGAVMDLIRNDVHQLITSADMIHSNNNLEQYNWGLEYGFHQLFFLRAGYKFSADEGGLALGTGLSYSLSGAAGLSLDYAYSDYGVLKAIHRASLALTF